MGGNLGGPTLFVILLIVLLLFGAPKLPALARSIGQSMRILKKEVGADENEAADGEKTSDSTLKNESTPKSDSTLRNDSDPQDETGAGSKKPE